MERPGGPSIVGMFPDFSKLALEFHVCTLLTTDPIADDTLKLILNASLSIVSH